MNREPVKLYVQLLDEGTVCYRPTEAISLGAGLFRLLPTPNYDPEDEVWEFLPGSVVKAETRALRRGVASEECLVAVALIDTDRPSWTE
jgi:hypothetical protein